MQFQYMLIMLKFVSASNKRRTNQLILDTLSLFMSALLIYELKIN